MGNVSSSLKKTGLFVVALIVTALIGPSASAQWTQSSNVVYPTSATVVGIGTTNPQFTLDVLGGTNTTLRVKSPSLAGFVIDRGTSSAPASFNFRTSGADNWIAGMGIYAAGTDFQIGNNVAPLYTFTTTGNLGIGTAAPAAKLDVVGNVNVSGSITAASVIGAVYQDIAEWVPATSKMTPGTVVVLNPAVSNEVMPSAQAYDTRVAGVVSGQPGVILGRPGDGKAQVATTGRVRVMVDAKLAGIKVGDLLVTSDELGIAMKSEPMDVNGRKFHQPGTILGKALEPLPSGRGEILVLLSLQ
jgi:hypothetical protein